MRIDGARGGSPSLGPSTRTFDLWTTQTEAPQSLFDQSRSPSGGPSVIVDAHANAAEMNLSRRMIDEPYTDAPSRVSHDEAAAATSHVGARGYVYDDDRLGRVHSAGHVLSFT